MKPSSEEDFLRKKAPVDRPLEEEDSAEVESSNDVIERMRGKEGQGEYHLKFSSLKYVKLSNIPCLLLTPLVKYLPALQRRCSTEQRCGEDLGFAMSCSDDDLQ